MRCEMDKDELTLMLENALTKVLNEGRSITDEQHRLDHEWLERQRENDRKWAARWDKFQTSLIGGLAVAILGGLGWIGKIVIDNMTRGNPP